MRTFTKWLNLAAEAHVQDSDVVSGIRKLRLGSGSCRAKDFGRKARRAERETGSFFGGVPKVIGRNIEWQ